MPHQRQKFKRAAIQVHIYLPTATTPQMMVTVVRSGGLGDGNYHAYHLTFSSQGRLLQLLHGWRPMARHTEFDKGGGSFTFTSKSRPRPSRTSNA